VATTRFKRCLGANRLLAKTPVEDEKKGGGGKKNSFRNDCELMEGRGGRKTKMHKKLERGKE